MLSFFAMADQSLKGLFKEFLSALTDLEKSFFHTMKSIALTPEVALEDFRSGKRELFPPFRFLMIALFFTVLSYQLTSDIVDETYYSEGSGFRERMLEARVQRGKSVDNFDEEAVAKQRDFLISYFPMIEKVTFVLAIPLACLIFFFVFREMQVTAAANIVAHVYFGSFLSMFSFPHTILLAYLKVGPIFLSLSGAIISVVYYTYVYYRVSSSNKSYRSSYLRPFSAAFLVLVTSFAVAFIISLGLGMYAAFKYPAFPSS